MIWEGTISGSHTAILRFNFSSRPHISPPPSGDTAFHLVWATSHTILLHINDDRIVPMHIHRRNIAHSDMHLRTLLATALAQGTFACLQEGRCRELSGRVQVCASGYWQEVNMRGYSCKDGLFLPNFPSSSIDSPSVLVGPPVQTSRQVEDGSGSSSTETLHHISTTSSVGSSSTVLASSLQSVSSSTSDPPSSTSVPPRKSSPDKEDVGYWYCNGKKPPTREEKSFTACYTLGGSMASVYYPEQPVFSCDIQPPSSNYFVAVWTRFVQGQQKQPQPKNCNEWLAIENPRNGRSATALVIDRCASCVGVGHQLSDSNVSDSYVNGATIDLSPALFSFLYEGAVEGVFDVVYNGSIYGGSWDGEPDALTDPDCST